MESDHTRQISLSIFQIIKPSCQRVSEIALRSSISDFDTLTYELRQILIGLAAHHENYKKEAKEATESDYVVSTKLADYVFYPISNLFKHPLLPEPVIQYILQILSFLVAHAWSHDIDDNLLEQLFALTVFLAGGDSIHHKRSSAIAGKSPELVSAASACLVALVKCLPRDYYTGVQNLEKRLSILGDTTTILLDALETLGPSSVEEITSILRTLAWLYSTRVTAEQASFVFPGIVSKIVNFHSQSKSLSTESLLAVLDILRALIVKVFSDKSLDLTITDGSGELQSPQALSSLLTHLNENTVPEETLVRVSITSSEKSHRTTAWLDATSKQLKLSIMIFMKNFILGANSRKRIASSLNLFNGIVEFVSDIVRTCFKALFRELIPSTVDILAALFYVATLDQPGTKESEILSKIESVYIILARSELELLYKVLYSKTENLIATQFPQILSSASEDKICLCVSALKVHLHVTSSLSKALLKPQASLDLLSQLVLTTLSTHITQNVSRDATTKLGAGKQELLHFLGGQNAEEKTNTLDEIELPPHIDAKRLGNVTKRENTLVPVDKTNVVKRLDLDLHTQTESPRLFSKIYSKDSETQIQSLVLFLGTQCGANSENLFLSLVVESDSKGNKIEELTQRTVSLWLSNTLFQSHSSTDSAKFDIDEFLDLDEIDESADVDEETSYLLVQTAQEMLDDTRALLEESNYDPRSREYKICENAYSVALATIGALASKLTKADFQADVLMDYLYPLLEALTYTPESQVHMQAKVSLNQIVTLHYNGSLENLIKDNSDYLIDSLSMNLSVASGLTPSLPGILLVVIRISGVDLLWLNQLQDILSEIFIVIDSFHGYSMLVENFFHVFVEIIAKVKEVYGAQLLDLSKLDQNEISPYKPWGITDRNAMFDLIDEGNKIVDPFADYDPEKEYFHRKPGVPFSEQEVDSDDEEPENEENQDQAEQEPAEPWPSPVPKNIYTSVQQIFTYGLQLLSHPSVKLKLQILHTLKEAYPIMSSNYKALMPLLAQYWPLLLVMSTGSSSLSEAIDEDRLLQTEQLIEPTLELMLVIFDEDKKHEKFMASRFIDMWEFLKKKAPVILNILSAGHLGNRDKAVSKRLSPKNGQLYSRLLITGINIYERSVPDLDAHEMVKCCRLLGFDGIEKLGRDVSNHLWVLTQAENFAF
ncbi:hypothetical protein METSCH_E02250 [Metschnikowia aff. pulcherrima]|uniref:TEL2-interacting protein 1 n=1 Tax=Metschnikowia aff. pulcherrima TaxID=2163413 RepID=A0A4P6XUT8_9ASCO|nr:hypothetical protein METSCH_E02250 [Metschnikowia aff. pulcherrima]